jgi:hypothetical protein
MSLFRYSTAVSEVSEERTFTVIPLLIIFAGR